MADLLWPGDERALLAFDQGFFLETMAEVEVVWLGALHRAGFAPGVDEQMLTGLVGRQDLADVAARAEASGNPVVPLVALMRERLCAVDREAAQWLHRGLTSQDVMDTATVLCARATTQGLLEHLESVTRSLVSLAERHRWDVMAGRTLTQHAVPITFGLKAAQWLQGVLDARLDLQSLRFPVQLGGAAGTLAGIAEVAGGPEAARELVAETASVLELDVALPWHTNRAPITRCADALVGASDAMGHIANDVLLLTRPEIAELAEPLAQGRGGSSTMPQKANPILSVLIRRAALAAPGLGSQLHLAAAEMVDERADGGWHLEWSALAALSRRTLVAASQTSELLAGLQVRTATMASVVEEQASALLAEQQSLRTAVGRPSPTESLDPRSYLGASSSIIDDILGRARGPQNRQESQ